MGRAFGSCEAGKYVAWLRCSVEIGRLPSAGAGLLVVLESCVLPSVVFLFPIYVVFLLSVVLTAKIGTNRSDRSDRAV